MKTVKKISKKIFNKICVTVDNPNALFIIKNDTGLIVTNDALKTVYSIEV